MRYLSAAAIGVAIAALSAFGADALAAGTSRHVTLRVGDVFVVAGTDVACQTQVGKHVIRGHRLVTCFKIKGGNLAPNSYIVALGDNGRVVVARIGANSNIGAPVFDRTPAGVGSGARQITAHAGDQFHLAGTNVGCVINDDVLGIYPTCFPATARGAVPGSYAFAETSTFAAVLKFNPTGKKTTVLFKRTHGR